MAKILNNTKICNKCILPETFPGIKFDSEGICNFCKKRKGQEEQALNKRRYKEKFLQLINELCSESSNTYDLLMAYSGGKDSTYTLYLLKEKYNLRILALSFDNGFLSPVSRKNIDTITTNLGIDHIYFKPRWDILKKIFRYASEHEIYSKKSLERASTICTTCIGLVKSITLKTALDMSIPLIGFGWSPGQAPIQSSILKNNPKLIKKTQATLLNPFIEIAGYDIKQYFLSDHHFIKTDFPYNVHPLAWEEYNENSILETIQSLGWRQPDDTDTNSTNCLLNAYANQIHIKRYGFHPYVWEIANMVRDGLLSREEGFRKIYYDNSEHLLQYAEEKLST